MLTEDLVALAVLRLGRPVRYEFSRTDEFVAAPCRHPFRVDVTVAAGADGVLTALAVDVLIDAGAYGNHSPGVMFHGCGESVAVYRCANKRVDAQAVYTNNIPSGAFRGYGLGQVIFAIESALDELAQRTRHRPVRASAPQRGGARRRVHRRPRRRRRPDVRQLRPRPVPRPRPACAWRRATAWRRRTVRSGASARAWRSR